MELSESVTSPPTVTITLERLRELEAAETRIRNKRTKDLERLNEYNHTHRAEALIRTQRCKEKYKDVYNAKRREQRRVAAAARAAAMIPGERGSDEVVSPD